ncbi:CYTH and CHAD domain-containing protein [Agreia sp. COWG]|uniref:CYTH and CHAD domain-containing protein n=1 Tax=Agreia sp. COWG TaxID=2773266 RepID=UPI001927A0C9|nr:CYTH and CHAD domain-containing protein [Agreia sp. COWG]CAD6007616.1 conserved protein of unknown function [Agreia sp. COWG]
MSHTSQVEIERKYDVGDEALDPTFTAVEGIEGVVVDEAVKLEAVYYDTEGLDLLRRRIIVRRREGGGDEGWHIKRPAREGRTELHWPLETASDVSTGAGSGQASGLVSPVPDAVLEPVRVVVRDRPLTPLARISTTRRATHLLNDRGQAVAEFADDSVTASDVRGGVVRAWREWEVELLAGAPDTEAERTALLDAIEVAVLAEDARVSASPAKIARALGVESVEGMLRAGKAASAGSPKKTSSSEQPLTSKSSAADVIVQVLRGYIAELERLDPLARADEPDAVHRMRAAARRIRSVLSAYGCLFTEQPAGQLRQQLRELGGVLGVARDAEVRAQRADDELDELGHRADDAARRRLVEGSLEQYRQAHAAALRLLSSATYYRLFDALDAFVADPPLSEAGKKGKPIKAVASAVIAAELKRLRQRAGAAAFAVASGASSVEAPREDKLHETRKAARRLRFAAEAVSAGETAVLGKKYRHIAEGAERVQDALGDHHDSVLFVEHLLRTSHEAHAAGENTFVYGALSARAEHRGAAALDSSPKALKRLDKRAESL